MLIKSARLIRSYRRVFLIAAVVLLQVGCGSAVLPDYVMQLDDRNQTNTSGGLRVTVRPVFDERESEKYFGKYLLANNIIAIFIKIENMDKTAYYAVKKRDIALSQPATGTGEYAIGMANGDEQTNASDYSAVASQYLLNPMSVQFPINESGKDSVLRANEYSTRSLAPGKEAHGFVYFSNDANHGKGGRKVLHLKAVSPLNGDAVTFAFDIDVPAAR
jgi:hypothetical protein